MGALLVINILIVNVALRPPNRSVTIPYDVFDRQLGAGNVSSVSTTGDTIQGEFKRTVNVKTASSPGPVSQFTTLRPSFASDNLLGKLLRQRVTVNARPVTVTRSFLESLTLSIAPWLLLIAAYFFVIRRFGSRFGLGIGRSKAKLYDPDTSARVTFDDVAGIDEVKADLQEIVDMLRDPERYRRLGAAIPKGVLLEGMPGTGKTLLARAVAGEADVPFFSSSASEFIEMVVGVGASRVRDLFRQASKVAPAIVFIDEIDAVGRARGGSVGGSGLDEREQTLNQILTEMDGFTGREGVIVLAATNRIDVLDQALLRPGRFDRRISVGAPDQRGREEILRVHTLAVPLAQDLDLGAVAASTPGMVGADLANLVNEAALVAARDGRSEVHASDFAEAFDKVVLGAARPLVMPAAQRRRTAYHEAGHAILAMVVPGADPVRKVSIVPRGQALGVTLQMPDEDRYNHTEAELRARIIGALGGRAAEEVVLGDVATGAESDLEKVALISRMMVARWGMSPAVGPLAVAGRPGLSSDLDGVPLSERLRMLVDDEVRRIVDECYDEARELLSRHRDALESLTQALLEHEALDADSTYRAAGFAPPEKALNVDRRSASRAG
jgi:cell division protease FtsH